MKRTDAEREAQHSVLYQQLTEHEAYAESTQGQLAAYLADFWGRTASDALAPVPAFITGPSGTTRVGTVTDPEDLGEAGDTLRPNYMYPHIASMISAVVPAQPRVSLEPIVPLDSIEDQIALAKAGAARAARIHDVFRQNRFAKILRRAYSLAALSGYAGGRVIWNPKRKRIEIDVVPRTRFWFDTTVSRWEDVRYVVWVSALRKDEFEGMAKGLWDQQKQRKNPDLWITRDIETYAQGGVAAGSLPHFFEDNMFGGVSARTATQLWVMRYDYYDFVTDRHSVWVSGCSRPLLDGPLDYRFVKNPFFICSLVDNLISLSGLADAQVVENWALARGEADTLAFLQARSNMPHVLLDKSKVKNADDVIAALRGARGPTAIAVELSNRTDTLDQAIQYTRGPTTIYDLQSVAREIDRTIQNMTATPDIARGRVGQAEVATEVAVADALRREQQTPRVTEVLETIEHIAAMIVGLDAEFMPLDQRQALSPGPGAPTVEISRNAMRLPKPTPEGWPEGADPTADFVVTAVAYAGAETHVLARGSAMLQRFPLLSTSPFVDQRGLIASILEPTGRLDLLVTPQEAAAAAGPPVEGQPVEGGDPLAGLLSGGSPSEGPPPQLLEQRAPGQDGVATGALALGDEPSGMGGMLGGAGFRAPMPGMPKPSGVE